MHIEQSQLAFVCIRRVRVGAKIQRKGEILMSSSLEMAAWEGWRAFRQEAYAYWNLFKSSRDEAEKNLESEFTNLFRISNNNNFEKNLRAFWEENYHFIVQDYTELLEIFKKINSINGCKSQILLPEIYGYQWENINGKDQPIAITKEFYDLIITTMNRQISNHIRILSKKDKKVYELVRRHYTDDLKHRVIYLYKEDVIIL